MYSVVYKGEKPQYTATIKAGSQSVVTVRPVWGLVRKSGFETQQAAEKWIAEQGSKIIPLSIILDWDAAIQCGRKVKEY